MENETRKAQMDRQQVIASIQNALAAEKDLVAVYLFGSLAQDRAGKLSDVDVALLFAHGLSPQEQYRRTLEIGQGLEQAMEGSVDLVDLGRASPLLCFQVIKTGQLVLERDRTARCLFQMKAMNDYYDAKPYLDYQRQMAIERIRREGLGRGYRGHRDALAEARHLRETLASAPASATR